MAVRLERRLGLTWVVVARLKTMPSSDLIREVKNSKLSVRLYDCVTEKTIALSLKARGVPIPARHRGVDRPLTFDPASEPDPFSPRPSHVITKKEGRYPIFAET